MQLPDSRNARSRNLSFVAVKSYLLCLFLCKNGKSNLQWLLFRLFGKKSITCGSWKWSNKRLLRPRHKNLSQISGGRERMKAPKNRLMAASRNGKKLRLGDFVAADDEVHLPKGYSGGTMVSFVTTSSSGSMSF